MAIAASVNHQKLAFPLQYRLNRVPGAGTIIHSLTAIGYKGTHIVRVNMLTRRRDNDNKTLLVQGHKGLTALGVPL
jgi:hypothetical protein